MLYSIMKDIGLLTTTAWHIPLGHHVERFAPDRLLKPVSRLDAGNPMSGVLYPSQDGLWIALTMPDTDRWWPTFAEVMVERSES